MVTPTPRPALALGDRPDGWRERSGWGGGVGGDVMGGARVEVRDGEVDVEVVGEEDDDEEEVDVDDVVEVGTYPGCH